MTRSIALLLATVLLSTALCAQKRKKKQDEEPKTQVLELPRELPATLTISSTQLRYINAPLSGRGLLTQQIKDGLRAIMKSAHGAPIVRLRALVAGTADMRRVSDVVSEELTDRKQPLPVLTTVLIGSVPLEGAQVQLEAMVAEKHAVNPAGVAFFSGQQVLGDDPYAPSLPVVSESLARLKKAFAGAGVEANEVLALTCFTHTISDAAAVLREMQSAAPAAALSLVQLSRAAARGIAECEATGRIKQAPARTPQVLNPEGLTANPNYSQVTLVGPVNLVVTGAKLGFRDDEADAKLVFQRVEKDLDQAHSSLKRTVSAHFYPLYPSIVERIRSVRGQYLEMSAPPASTLLVFEGLPSMDALWAMDVIAVAP